MVLNATFNNISVISWRSVLLVEEETRVPGKNHRPPASHWHTLSHNVILSTPHLSGIRTHNVSGDMHWLVSSCKSNYNTDHYHNGPDGRLTPSDFLAILIQKKIFIGVVIVLHWNYNPQTDIYLPKNIPRKYIFTVNNFTPWF